MMTFRRSASSILKAIVARQHADEQARASEINRVIEAGPPAASSITWKAWLAGLKTGRGGPAPSVSSRARHDAASMVASPPARGRPRARRGSPRPNGDDGHSFAVELK
jgi:hypothetical protein